MIAFVEGIFWVGLLVIAATLFFHYMEKRAARKAEQDKKDLL